MATRTSHNKNNSAVKRIMQEARELANDTSTDYSAAPLEDNLFEWHCTMRGPPQTDFEGGLYHFRIILPAEYPFRPPSIMMLTPSGRFETNTQICISFTNYHEELWQPAWGVRTAIIGLQGFFPLKGQAAVGVGSMEAPSSERKRLAKLSREWSCPHCKVANLEHLPDAAQSDASNVPLVEGKQAKHQEQVTAESSEAFSTPSTETPLQNAMMSHSEPSPARSAEEPVVPSPSRLVNSTPISETPSSASVAHRRPHTVSQPKSEAITIQSSTAASTVGSASASSVIPEAIPIVSSAQSRPPILLDAAILVLLVLVAALLCRKIF